MAFLQKARCRRIIHEIHSPNLQQGKFNNWPVSKGTQKSRPFRKFWLHSLNI